MKRALLVSLYFLLLPVLLPTMSKDGTAFYLQAQSGEQSGEQAAGAEESAGEEPAEPSWWQKLLGFLKLGKETAESEKPVFEKYASVFNYIHQDELQYFDSLRQLGIVDWDHYFSPDLVYEKYRNPFMTPIDASMKVFGWHPYWMGDAYKGYQYKLLTHVAWFAYNLDPATGSYTNPEVIEEWKKTELVKLAHTDSCKVLLTVTSHQLAGNKLFLDNAANQQRTFVDSITLLLKLQEADGVDLNFENLPAGYEKKLSGFIRRLKDRLTADGYLLTVSLPKLNRYKDPKNRRIQHRYYEVDTLQKYVDFFVITAYDFHHPFSETDGPIAPLYAGDNELSIENVVYSYLEDGLDRKKLILGLPYYGGVWKAMDDDPKSKSSLFERHLTYRDAKAKAFIPEAIAYDTVGWSAYYVEEDTVVGLTALPFDTVYAFTKYWFDDTLTLRKKFSWAVAQDLGGVGIWALGYDNKHLELWSLIDSVFTTANIGKYQHPGGTRLSVIELLVKYKLVLVVAGIFLLGFLAIGFVAALFDWRVREVFFTNKTLRLLYIIGGFTLIIAVFVAGSSETDGLFASNTSVRKAILFVLGLGLGGALTMLAVRLFERKRERTP